MIDFESEFQKIKDKFAGEPDLNWEALDNNLQRMERRINLTPDERTDIQHYREECLAEFRRRFEAELAKSRDDLNLGLITSTADLNRYVNRLADLARPAGTQLTREITLFREEWANWNKIHALQVKVMDYIAAYKIAVANGEDNQDAANKHLEPAKAEIERMSQELGSKPEVVKLLGDIKKAIKDADKTALYTNAASGKFKVIIEDLERKPDDYVENLVDEHNAVHGQKPKVEAILWYQRRAEIFAENKADEYLQQARKELGNEQPGLADQTLNQAEGLFRLPEFKRAELQVFREQQIDPVLRRIDYARNQIRRILNGQNLDEMLACWNNALSDEFGWPALEKLFADSPATDPDRLDLVSQARNHIYEAVGQYIQTKLALLEEAESSNGQPPSPHYLLHALDESELAALEKYLQWSDGRLMRDYGRAFNKLKTEYRRQNAAHKAIQDSLNQARQAKNGGNYQNAYALLQPFEAVIKADATYRDARNLFVELEAYQNISTIKARANGMLDAGINESGLDWQVEQIDALLADLNQTRDANPAGAALIGLNGVIQEVQHFLFLLRGLICLNRIPPDYTGAIDQWKRIPKTSQRFGTEAESRIRAIETLIHDDRELDAAYKDGQTRLDRADLRGAYRVMKAHINKTSARNYADFSFLFNRVREQFGEQLQNEMLANIAAQPLDPALLIGLRQECEEVAPDVVRAMALQIDRAIRIETALRDRQLALPTRNVDRWTTAQRSWQALYDVPDLKGNMDEVYIRYVTAKVDDALNQAQTVDADANLNAKRAQLSAALTEIAGLKANVPQSSDIEILRARIFVRLAEMGDQPQYVKGDCLTARSELSHAAPEFAATDEYPRLMARIVAMEALALQAEDLIKTCTVQHPLKDWQASLQQWQTVLREATGRAVGLQQWYAAFVAQQVEALSRLIEAQELYWLRIEPIAKFCLLDNPETVDDLAVYFTSLQESVNAVLNDMRGVQVTEGLTEPLYLEQLVRATEAFVYLLKLYIVPPEDYQGDIRGETEILLHQILGRQDEIKLLFQILANARRALTNASASGSFDQINQILAPIRNPNGRYKIYEDHRAVREFEAKLKQGRDEYARLRAIADQVAQDFAAESFEKLLPEVAELLKPDASVYNAPLMISVSDPFANNASIEHADDLRIAVEAKLAQIRLLERWLAPLIDADRLAAIPIDPAAPVVDLAITRVVNFPQVWTDDVLPLRNQAHYQEALNLLDRIAFGASDQDQPAQPFAVDVLSIEMGLDVLRQMPVNENGLKSTRAVAIFEWARTLWKMLNAQWAIIEQRRGDLEESEREFERERQRFIDAFQVLRNRRMAGDRKRLEEQLHEAYARIRLTAATPADKGVARLYPLAPEWDGLDENYQPFKRA